MNPIELMDGIERTKDARYEDGGVVTVLTEEWQSLRAAAEAREQYVAGLEFQNSDLEDECREQFTKLEAQAGELAQAKKGWETTSEYAKGCGETIAMLQEELAQARARIGRLEGFLKDKRLRFKGGMGSPHLPELDALLNESPAQSLAAVRAEALRSAASAMQLEFDANHLFIMADRIEREAKESG